MTDCDIDPESLLCRVCGAAVSAAHVRRNCRPGLGDMVAAGLDAIGITKDRVQAVASAVSVKDCGCKQRQQKMNSWGAKHLGIGTPESP